MNITEKINIFPVVQLLPPLTTIGLIWADDLLLNIFYQSSQVTRSGLILKTNGWVCAIFFLAKPSSPIHVRRAHRISIKCRGVCPASYIPRFDLHDFATPLEVGARQLFLDGAGKQNLVMVLLRDEHCAWSGRTLITIRISALRTQIEENTHAARPKPRKMSTFMYSLELQFLLLSVCCVRSVDLFLWVRVWLLNFVALVCTWHRNAEGGS